MDFIEVKEYMKLSFKNNHLPGDRLKFELRDQNWLITIYKTINGLSPNN